MFNGYYSKSDNGLMTLDKQIESHASHLPKLLDFLLYGIALATAPAPALSIVSEFHAQGSVTDTLLLMAVLDDMVGIVIFFTVNSIVAGFVSGDSVPLYMIPAMIAAPVLIGIVQGTIAAAAVINEIIAVIVS